MEETDMVGLPTDTKGLGTDPSQKQYLPVILIASKGKVSLMHVKFMQHLIYRKPKINFYHCLNFKLLLNTIYILVFIFIITASTEEQVK
jgi:hypothetical protein